MKYNLKNMPDPYRTPHLTLKWKHELVKELCDSLRYFNMPDEVRDVIKEILGE